MSHIEEGRLHAYLDGQLPARERSEVGVHVAACAECRARLDAAEELARASHAILGQVDPGPGRPAPWPEIEARGAVRSRRPRRGAWLDPRLAWAATIALAFAVGWLTRGVQGPPERMDPKQTLVRETETAVGPSAPGEAAEIATTPSQQERAGPERERAAAAPARMAEQADDTPQPAAGRAAELAPETPAPAAEQREVRRRSEQEARRRADEEAQRRIEERDDAARLERRAYAAQQKTVTQPADSLARGARVAPGEITANALRMQGVTIAEDAAFVAIGPGAAETWLGVPLRTLVGLTLEWAEVGPGAAVRGGVSGRPVVRLVYRDDAGRTVTLLQQRLESGVETDTLPTLIVAPSGSNAYRWTDRGYVLTLQAELGADSLRALAARVR